MNVTNFIVNEVPNNGYAELTTEEKGLINQVIEYVHGSYTVLQNSLSIKKFESTISGHKEHEEPSDSSLKVTQINRFIKFDDQLIVNLIKSTNVDTGKSTYLAKAISLVQDNGKTKKHIAVTYDGELMGDVVLDTDDTKLELIENFTELSGDEIGESDIEAQDLPCIQNGCCSFRYNGSPLNPLVIYKWCGAGCGSGTPVNDLDKCCKTHDECYGTNKSYPGRCTCDRRLLGCASLTDEAGTTRLIAAFIAKAGVNGC